MKKLLGIVVLVLMFFNIVLADSFLPACKGTDTSKWTNCFELRRKILPMINYIRINIKTKKFYSKVNIEMENFMAKEP